MQLRGLKNEAKRSKCCPTLPPDSQLATSPNRSAKESVSTSSIRVNNRTHHRAIAIESNNRKRATRALLLVPPRSPLQTLPSPPRPLLRTHGLLVHMIPIPLLPPLPPPHRRRRQAVRVDMRRRRNRGTVVHRRRAVVRMPSGETGRVRRAVVEPVCVRVGEVGGRRA